MDISVIIPNYNTKNETAACVRSCLGDGAIYKIEIIIVDNGSEDGSYDYLNRLFKRYSNVTILKKASNEGFSKAVNAGLIISKGKYKYILNSDTKIKKGTFSKMIGFIGSREDIGVVGTKLILPDGSIQKSCFNFPGIINAIKEYWLGYREVYSSFYKNTVSEVDAVVGASFFITPVAYKLAGLFDERYFMYYEDIDYCRRVQNFGLKVFYLPEVEVFHSHGLSGAEFADKDKQWRRLIPSSKIYNGIFKYYILNYILWTGQKFNTLKKAI